MQNKPKEPLVAVLLNCLFLGWGHLYAGAKNKAKLFFVGNAVLCILMIGWAIHPTADLKFLAGGLGIILTIFYFAILVIFILILMDGYKCAKKYNLQNGQERRISGGRRFLLILVIIIAFSGLNFSLPLIFGIRAYILQTFKVPSEAMSPTLEIDDRFLVSKLAYKGKDPERGDIAVFVYPVDPARDFVKRVIAKGGESVEIREGHIYINDVIIDLPVIKNIHYYNRGDYGKEGQRFEVPPGHFFVLGDNSASSMDSRFWGFVPRENFIGKVYKIYYPFERSGAVR